MITWKSHKKSNDELYLELHWEIVNRQARLDMLNHKGLFELTHRQSIV